MIDWMVMQKKALETERRLLDLIENLNQRIILEGEKTNLLERRVAVLETIAGERRSHE